MPSELVGRFTQIAQVMNQTDDDQRDFNHVDGGSDEELEEMVRVQTGSSILRTLIPHESHVLLLQCFPSPSSSYLPYEGNQMRKRENELGEEGNREDGMNGANGK